MKILIDNNNNNYIKKVELNLNNIEEKILYSRGRGLWRRGANL